MRVTNDWATTTRKALLRDKELFPSAMFDK